MKKTTKKKLSLNSETLRTLADGNVRRAVGGQQQGSDGSHCTACQPTHTEDCTTLSPCY